MLLLYFPMRYLFPDWYSIVIFFQILFHIIFILYLNIHSLFLHSIKREGSLFSLLVSYQGSTLQIILLLSSFWKIMICLDSSSLIASIELFLLPTFSFRNFCSPSQCSFVSVLLLAFERLHLFSCFWSKDGPLGHCHLFFFLFLFIFWRSFDSCFTI